MARRTFAGALLALACAGTLAAPAQAQDVRDAGCVALGGVVSSSLYAAASGSGGNSMLQYRPAPRADGPSPSQCGRTAAVASGAFTKTFGALGIDVHWRGRNEPMDPGDYCLSGDLSQCYPSINDRVAVGSVNSQFVQKSWQGISAAISQAMPYGTASDLSYFFEVDLASSIALSLRATLYRVNEVERGW